MATLLEMEARLKKESRKNKNGYVPVLVPQKKQAAYQIWKKCLKSSIKRMKIIKSTQA
ncbi:hypothetical protein [Atlantibacter hermannii]|uniref:hypothetical protein n=1 Tax=Atlantibacter hermannii TaxID=565 RepID=UPI0028A0E52B|nr:hypothetical protein [Atlantibacter hermannii]